MKCSICEKEKKKILNGYPIICISCFKKLNGINQYKSRDYLSGFRDGKHLGILKFKEYLLSLLAKEGLDAVINVLNS